MVGQAGMQAQQMTVESLRAWTLDLAVRTLELDVWMRCECVRHFLGTGSCVCESR